MGKKQRVRRLRPDREVLFPMLVVCDYNVASKETPEYNCIALAAGDYTTKWDCPPIRGQYFWPLNAKQGNNVDALMSAFATLGYEKCEDCTLEIGFEKIAIYADQNGVWQHAAKLTKDGYWISKLGDWEDIRHKTLDALECADYGSVVGFMRRRSQKRPKRHGRK